MNTPFQSLALPRRVREADGRRIVMAPCGNDAGGFDADELHDFLQGGTGPHLAFLDAAQAQHTGAKPNR